MNVIELFAGVGGFRLGLERASDNYHIVWSNQWEPSTKVQTASNIYARQFNCGQLTDSQGKVYEEHSNVDINLVDVNDIPQHEMLVGGFPCQDYSVASTLSRSGGIEGKKGVLWWNIERILREKEHPANYLFLENVDRLINSPAKQRGRDFAIMLNTLAKLDYIVEWRIINAADYGKAQRRRRTYILAYKKGTPIYNHIKLLDTPWRWLLEEGTIATAYPVNETVDNNITRSVIEISKDTLEVSEKFNYTKTGSAKTPFCTAGILVGYKVYTLPITPNVQNVTTWTTLGDVLIDENDVPEEYFIDERSLERWKYEKGGKKINRISKDGFSYVYSEGSMSFPDSLDKPSRTIITGEGGPGPSRFKHVVEQTPGHYRRLTPVELERLNGFPDNHTVGATPIRRAFLMGNALVVGVVEDIANNLMLKLKEYGE